MNLTGISLKKGIAPVYWSDTESISHIHSFNYVIVSQRVVFKQLP